MMRKIISFSVVICLLMTIAVSSFAEPIPSAVAELYSADGYYVDSVGNGASYSYHVPQITASSPAAEEINREIAERTGFSSFCTSRSDALHDPFAENKEQNDEGK